jgi:hypothetical protein
MSADVDQDLDLGVIAERWRAAWPDALDCWGPSLRLAEPVFVTAAGAPAALAWFDLDDVRATVDLRTVVRLGLQDDPLPVLAHEIGHHVLAPADATGRARIVERCRRGLGDRPEQAALVSNLWTDLLINDRLHRLRGLDLTGPYVAARRLAATPVARRRRGAAGDPHPAPTSYFDVYLRAYERLWSLPRGSLVDLAGAAGTGDVELDAGFLARHARVFARDPVGGAAGFAALVRRYLPGPAAPDAVAPSGPLVASGPCRVVANGSQAPDVGEADDLTAPVVHPARDPRVNPLAREDDTPGGHGRAPDGDAVRTGVHGQGFGPSDLATLYTALDLDRDAAVDWYRARARRHLVPFPVDREAPESEPELQGLETWEVGDDLAEVDWIGTTSRSATVLPGMTTVRRVVESDRGSDPRPRPVDLDLYVDSSGSMPDPRGLVSPAVLGGAVLVLSALRVGARVRVTSWSGPGQVTSSGGLARDEPAALAALLTYHGGGTSFPLAQLADAHPRRAGRGGGGGGGGGSTGDRRCHVAVISDDGVESLFGTGQPPELHDAAHTALAGAGGGGTLVLQVPPGVAERTRARAGDWSVVGVQEADDIVGLARSFAARRWGADR